MSHHYFQDQQTTSSNMKLRVRMNKQTRRVELEGPDPTLTQLNTRVKEDLLPSAGLSTDTEFTLSLNGKEPLVDTGQTLSSCGVVSGDMISVILPCSDSSSSSPSTSSYHVSAVQQNASQSQAGLATLESGASSNESTQTVSDPETEEMSMERGEDEDEAVGHFIPEPMLCCEAEEGKVPHSLEMLYQATQCKSAPDCLLLVTHVLLLETGFLPQGCDVRAGKMPSSWRAAGGLYRLHYTHPLCENCLAQVVAVPMGQTLVLNATLKMSSAVESSRKLVLKPESYVTKEWAGGSAGAAYRDLPKLSRVFKDQLAYPLIATAREALGLPALFGLAALPPELLLRIMRLLDVTSLLKLSEVCRHLHSTTHDASLWKHLLHRDFRVNIQADTEHRDTDWKKLYKKRFKQKKIQGRYRPRYYPYSIPPLYPPSIPPGILPRPRYDPIRPFFQEPRIGLPFGRRLLRPGGSRAPDSGTSSNESTQTVSDPETEEMSMERGEDEDESVGQFIPEPMLCCEAEEGKVPHSLEMLYQATQCKSAPDCLVLLLETGFLPQGCDVRAGKMPSGWCAAGGLYRLHYTHPLCENCLAQVVAVPMGQTLVLNATLKMSSAVESSRKLVLKPESYVTKEWAGGSAGAAYRDLPKMSRVFKDQLAYPLIATAREALGLPALFGLAVLPPELQLRIMRLLDVTSLLKLSEVCVNIQADTEHRDTDWKKLYKKQFKQKKIQGRYRGGDHNQRPPIPPSFLLLPRQDPIEAFFRSRTAWASLRTTLTEAELLLLNLLYRYSLQIQITDLFRTV